MHYISVTRKSDGDDGDGNEKGKKAVGLTSKQQLCMSIRLIVHYFFGEPFRPQFPFFFCCKQGLLFTQLTRGNHRFACPLFYFY